jgi:hypothetical protein
MGDEGRESIDMGTQLDLDKIAFLDGGGVLLEGSIVCAHFVDRDGGGEGKSFENWLLVIHFR